MHGLAGVAQWKSFLQTLKDLQTGHSPHSQLRVTSDASADPQTWIVTLKLLLDSFFGGKGVGWCRQNIPQRTLWEGVEFIEQGCNEGGVQRHEHHGHDKNKRPEVQRHKWSTVQQDVDKCSQQWGRNYESQKLRFDEIGDVKRYGLLVEAMSASRESLMKVKKAVETSPEALL